MSVYSSILLATDAADSREEMCQVFDTAIEWADAEAANLKILHTVPPIGQSGVEYQLPSFSEIEDDLMTEAEDKVSEIVEEMCIEDANPSVVFGNFDEEVLKEKNVDLVVINNDNETYWGSKAEAILQGNCDLLAVKT